MVDLVKVHITFSKPLTVTLDKMKRVDVVLRCCFALWYWSLENSICALNVQKATVEHPITAIIFIKYLHIQNDPVLL